MSTIADLGQEVVVRVEGRTRDIGRAYVWVRDALIEIAGNPDYRETFDDLEVTGPVFNLTGGDNTTSVQEYDFDSLVNSGDYIITTLDIRLWTDYPDNRISKQLDNKDFQVADRFLQSPSIPAFFYRFGHSVGFVPTPSQNYQVQARIMRRHPLNDPIENTTILIPLEWNEILVWAATMRGFMELLQYEKAAQIRTLLYGDPKYPEKPGIIEGVKRRKQNEAWLQTKSLKPVIRSYGYGNY